MTGVRLTAAACAALFFLPSICLAANTRTESQAIQTLATSSDKAAQIKACQTLYHVMWSMPAADVPINAKPQPSANGSAAIEAMSKFIAGPAAEGVRIECMTYMDDLAGALIEGKTMWTAVAYAPRASAAFERLLKSSASTTVRLAAVHALGRLVQPSGARALLWAAAHDPSVDVRVASLQNLYWGASYDIKSNHDLPMYDAALNEALKSGDVRIVGAALIAKASLHRLDEFPEIRLFALDPRPPVRASAIEAIGAMMMWDHDTICFVQSRLTDPDASVRDAARSYLARRADSNLSTCTP